MTTFHYKASDIAGDAELRNGPVAPSSAWSRLARLRLFGGVRRKQIIHFTRSLATLQEAGMPIVRSMRILEDQQGLGSMRGIIADMATYISSRHTLAQAIDRHPDTFDPLYAKVVAVGEAAGTLELALKQVAQFMEKSQRIRREIINSMIYPLFLVAFTIVVVTFILSLSGTMGQFLINAGTVFLVIFGVPLAFILAMNMVRHSQAGSYFIDQLKLNMPLFGKVHRKAAAGRFSRAMGTLLATGMPILQAIRIARETFGNEVFVRALDDVRQNLDKGETLACSLQASGIYDIPAGNMIEVGEENGQLDKMLIKVADDCDEEVHMRISYLQAALPPIVMIIVCLIVGSIIISLYARCI